MRNESFTMYLALTGSAVPRAARPPPAKTQARAMHALVFVREQRGEMRYHAVFITSPALASSTILLATTYLTEKETTGESQLRQGNKHARPKAPLRS